MRQPLLRLLAVVTLAVAGLGAGPAGHAATTTAATAKYRYDHRGAFVQGAVRLTASSSPAPARFQGGIVPVRLVARLGVAAEDRLDIEGASFAQTTASNSFSSGGSFAGETIKDVAGELRSGALSPGDVPIQVIERDGSTLILNTRSALALERAGIPRSEWVLDNMTGNAAAEARLSAQLGRNGLGSAGTSTVRIVGGR